MFQDKNSGTRISVFIVSFEHVFRPFSSVTINNSERKMFAGLRLLNHRSDNFFACILFSKYILLGFYVIISSKIISVPADQCHSLLTRITIFVV